VIESVRPLKENGLDVFIRHKIGVDILHKVQSFKEPPFMGLVSARKPFGFDTTKKGSFKSQDASIALYQNGGVGYIKLSEIPKGREMLPLWKVYISCAYGAGENYPHQILGVPIIGQPNSACTETYMVIGPFKTRQESENVARYLSTRFFRFLVMLKKNTQHATAKVYELVPMQDFSKPWTDEELYKKYGLTEEEIAFIESMIRPMEVDLNG
jgi:site-specific DNA-methyltransferase (adenine-specific)